MYKKQEMFDEDKCVSFLIFATMKNHENRIKDRESAVLGRVNQVIANANQYGNVRYTLCCIRNGSGTEHGNDDRIVLGVE
jgi:hypothetical protein